MRGGLTGRREVFNTGCGRSYWAQRGLTGCEEGLLGAGSPYCAQGDLTCAGHCGVVWSWRQGVSVGSDMIPSRASSGMVLALMHAIKGGDQEAAGRCWFVASLFHSHAGPPNVAGSSSGPPWHRRYGALPHGGSLLPRTLRVRAESYLRFLVWAQLRLLSLLCPIQPTFFFGPMLLFFFR